MKNNWMVYILELENKSFYTGITNDLLNRIKLHINGKGSKYVRSHLPIKILYVEGYYNKSFASKREIEIKKMKRIKKEKIIFEQNNKCKECGVKFSINFIKCIICQGEVLNEFSDSTIV